MYSFISRISYLFHDYLQPNTLKMISIILGYNFSLVDLNSKSDDRHTTLQMF